MGTARYGKTNCKSPGGIPRNGRPTPTISGTNCARPIRTPVRSRDPAATLAPGGRLPGAGGDRVLRNSFRADVYSQLQIAKLRRRNDTRRGKPETIRQCSAREGYGKST